MLTRRMMKTLALGSLETVRGYYVHTCFFENYNYILLNPIQQGGGGGKNASRHLIGQIDHKLSLRRSCQWLVNISLSITVT